MAIGGKFGAMLAVWDIASNQVACYCSCHHFMLIIFLCFLQDLCGGHQEEENYKHLRKRLFHDTMLCVDCASGEAGDRRLSSKRKSQGFNEPPAVGNAENETPDVEPPAPASAHPAAPAAEGAAAASCTPPTLQPPATKGAGGGQR